MTFEWFNKLSLNEMVERAAALPPRSAIYYPTVRVDAQGVPHEEDRVLTRLRERARAPIFSYIDSSLGLGIVGGPLYSTGEIAQKSAAVAVRILQGESPADITTPPIGMATPTYDWRELKRWNISESLVPPGSEIRFRPLTLWDQYRWHLIAIATAILLQALVIAGLLFERRRRHTAERQSQQRLQEVVHLNRTATAGALSASIAHELNQPLGSDPLQHRGR